MAVNNAPSLRLVFDRRKKASKLQAETLYFEVMYKRIRKYVHSGIRLFAGQWNEKTNTIVNHRDAVVLNNQLEALRRSYLDTMLRHVNSPMGFDLEDYIREISREQKRELSFIGFALERASQRGLEQSTYKQHLVALNALQESGLIVSFKDVTKANIMRFDAWLRTKRGLTHQHTIYGYHKRIKVYVREAYVFEYIKENPYDTLSIPRGDNQKLRYLVQAEVDKIRSLDIENACLDRVRRLFVLQIYTGLSYSDMYAVDWANAERRSDGRYYIRQRRIKTNEEYYLLLLPPAVEVLESFGWTLPTISNQKYNSYLKGLGIACGITKSLTSHIARHTFATTITLSNKVPIEIVAKMMGHSDIKTTQRYAKVLAEDVIDAFIGLEGVI